jgi:hypothetical protein
VPADSDVEGATALPGRPERTGVWAISGPPVQEDVEGGHGSAGVSRAHGGLGAISGPPVQLSWGREVCGDLDAAERREWLCTNGLGGFASGTIAGTLTRRYHGLLIAALAPPLGRTLVAAKLEEDLSYAGGTWALGANRWADGTLAPEGFRDLERFHLDGTTPVWTYACADALLERRVWTEPGANTTYVRYAVGRRRAPGAETPRSRQLPRLSCGGAGSPGADGPPSRRLRPARSSTGSRRSRRAGVSRRRGASPRPCGRGGL